MARRDAQGNKLNKIRKSYENSVKDLPGKDKVRRQDGELRNISAYPEEEWNIQKVHGKELSNGLTESMLARLKKATTMGGGKLPEQQERRWRGIVDADGSTVKPLGPQLNNSIKRTSDESPPYTAVSPTNSEATRPSRRGTKRRYDDESFEGYGEGFVDDHAETTSNDLADDPGDGGSTAKRKRRRVRFPTETDHMRSPPSSIVSTPTKRGWPARKTYK